MSLQVRVGIATGDAVVGDLVGQGEAQERGIVGSTPNLAARLQSIAEPGRVVISQATRRLTGRLFALHDLGAQTVKGFANPVQAWLVVEAHAHQNRFEAHRDDQLTSLVGRDEEFDLLLRRWQRAKSGDGQVVLLSGEPGIGKSRLAAALEDRLHEEPHTRLRYFCSPHHTESPLFPMISQLERLAGFERSDAPEQRLAKLESVLELSSTEDKEELALLAELSGVTLSEHMRVAEMSPQRRKDKTLGAFRRQLERRSEKNPVLVIFEDIHWIDPTTRELLDLPPPLRCLFQRVSSAIRLFPR